MKYRLRKRSEHQHGPWQPRGRTGGSCCLRAGWTLLSPDPASTVPTATGQQGHSRPLLRGMPGPSPAVALGAAGTLPGLGSQHTGSAPQSPTAEQSRSENQSTRLGRAGARGSYFCFPAEGFCVALLLPQKQIWAAELTERISEH